MKRKKRKKEKLEKLHWRRIHGRKLGELTREEHIVVAGKIIIAGPDETILACVKRDNWSKRFKGLNARKRYRNHLHVAPIIHPDTIFSLPMKAIA